MNETMRDMWQSFALSVLPANAPTIQKTEMRRAFYGGAWAMLCKVKSIGEPDVSEEDGVACLERMKTECEEFTRLMLEGKA